jgi:hypothetical protein
MPCQYYAPGEAASIRANEYKAELDRLTRENDRLRELVLTGAVNPDERKKIEKEQIKHRKEDLARLKKTFTDQRDAKRLGLVMLADPKRPLEAQLGFDPDDF